MTASERAEVKDLIHDLYVASGKPSWAAFARAAGVSEYSLRDWRSGDGAPSAINLIRLLAAVGWLDRKGQAGEDPVQQALETLRQGQEELTETVRDGFAALSRRGSVGRRGEH